VISPLILPVQLSPLLRASRYERQTRPPILWSDQIKLVGAAVALIDIEEQVPQVLSSDPDILAPIVGRADEKVSLEVLREPPILSCIPRQRGRRLGRMGEGRLKSRCGEGMREAAIAFGRVLPNSGIPG
jgi:hypothetical protein